MRTKKYPVILSLTEKKKLEEMTHKGHASVQTVTRAKALLLSHEGKSNAELCEKLDICRTTAITIRRRYSEAGIERALHDAPRSGQPPALSGKEEAKIVAIACTHPPDGYGKWTLDLLEEKVSKEVKPVGRTTVYNVLLRNETKPWREKNVVHSEDNAPLRAKNDGRAGSVRTPR